MDINCRTLMFSGPPVVDKTEVLGGFGDQRWLGAKTSQD